MDNKVNFYTATIAQRVVPFFLPKIYATPDLSGKGIGGHTELAHVNPEEMAVLRAMGGAGTINPNTNLIQFIGGGGASSPPPPPAVQTQVQQSEFPSELKPFISDNNL